MSSAEEREILREISYWRRDVGEHRGLAIRAAARGDHAEAAKQEQLAEQASRELARAESELEVVVKEREQE